MKHTILLLLLFCSYSISGLLAQNTTWSPDLPVNTKTFTEAEKQQQRINGQKLMDTLSMYLSKPSIDKTVIIREDCRFTGDGSFYISFLKKTKIIGAKGKDITFWFDSPHIWGLKLEACSEIAFSNITFDCDPVPFTQGKIISKSSNSSVVLQPMKGYETLISNANGIFAVFNPDGTFKKHPGAYTCNMVQNADKTISLTNGTFAYANIGDYVVLPSRTGAMISLSQCENVVLDTINVYSSGGMVCYLGKGVGGHLLRHVIATRRPGTNRLWMNGADGFHVNELAKGPVIEDCEMSYTADDFINIHGRFGWVASKVNNSKNNFRVIFSPGAIKAGQRIDFWDNNTQEYRGTANVTKVSSVTNSADIQAAQSTAIQHLGGSVYDIQLDADVNADLGSLIEHHANVCSGFVIRNCRLHDTFNRGLLINGASDGIIEGNTIENVGSGQSFHMETWMYGEGQYIRNLIVRNNTLKNAGGLWFGLVPPGGNTIYGAYRSTPMSNIQILNNRIELSPGDISGISMTYIDSLKIEGNTIVRDMSDSNWNQNDMNFTDGYGKSNESAIFATGCKNVIINNNTVQELTPNTAKKADYGLLVNNIELDGVKQYNSVADIVTGWLQSGKQDDLGWSYGNANANTVRNGNYSKDSFVKMGVQSNSIWTPSASLFLPSIGRMSTQPGVDLASVIRWTSNVNGKLKISGKIKNSSSLTLGNKVLVIIYVNGNERYRYDTSNGNITLNVDLGNVEVGNYVDFVVDSKGNTLGDQTVFNFKYLSDGSPATSLKPISSNKSFKAYSLNGQLVVIPTKSNQLLSVFRMDGILQFSKKISDSVQYISLAKGAYIVKLDKDTTKVVI